MRISRFISTRRVIGALVAMGVMVCAIAVPAGTAQAIEDPSYFLRMQNAETFRYLTIGNGSTTPGTSAIQWTWLSGREQQWSFEKVDDESGDSWDQWIITNGHSNDCLAIPAGSTADGTGAIQWPCTWLSDTELGLPDQRWYVQPDSVLGGYRIMNVKSGKCLAIPAGNTTLGIQAIQWTCAYDLDQRWWLF
ncbi:RICIN domain-containing protein [Kribbella sp. NPDC003505]|uniref:RICIN domain-containing protein n=1 Tax=Kribbella sp. NPDC003505 TaxID=3154448 RepID=UPI0033AAFF7C